MRHKEKTSKIKFIMLFFAVLVVCLLSYNLFFKNNNSEQKPSQNQTSKPDVKKVQSKTLKLIATGDMLPHDTVNQAARTADGYNYKQFFKHVEPYFKEADIAFCNQESPSSENIAVAGYPSFNAPPQFSNDLNSVGCNLVNLANNHSYDKGQAGIDDTLSTWDKLPVLAKTGIYRNATEQKNITYFEKSGLKFAFLSYIDCSNNSAVPRTSINFLDKAFTKTQIEEAKNNSDMIITSVHWCKENVSEQSTKQDEWAKYFADNGVDIVIGTGPHYLQPVKKLEKSGGGNTIVWFSLGNFLSTQEHINGLIGGIATMEIDIENKNVSGISFRPVYMHYEWTAAEKARNDLLKRENLMLYPLADSAEPLAKSQNNTTVQEQIQRVTGLMNKYTSVKIDL